MIATSLINTDYAAEARCKSREQFVAEFGCCFLLRQGQLRAPRRPSATVSLTANPVPTDQGKNGPPPIELDPGEHKSKVELQTELVLAVRKVQSVFPHMITVGRTANNDVHIADVSVSRFHAFFRISNDEVSISDAGSRNGTLVNGRPIKSRGGAVPIKSGTLVRFGSAEFRFLRAGDLWHRLTGTPG